MEAGGGETSASVKGIPDNAAKCFSFYRCLGCCLSWIQVGINAQHASTRKARCGRIRMNAISIRCVVGLVVALRMFHDTFLRRQLPCRHWHSERRGRGCRHYARTDADTLLLVRTCNCVSLIVRVCRQASKQFQLWCMRNVGTSFFPYGTSGTRAVSRDTLTGRTNGTFSLMWCSSKLRPMRTAVPIIQNGDWRGARNIDGR